MGIKVKTTQARPENQATDLAVYFARQTGKGAAGCQCGPQIQTQIDRASAVGDFSGKEGQSLLVYPEPAAKAAKRVLVVGLGEEKPTSELFRQAGGHAAGMAGKTESAKMLVVTPEDLGLETAAVVQGLCEGLLLGSYKFKKYKTKKEPDEQSRELEEITFSASQKGQARKGAQQGRIVAEAIRVARDMAHEPANYWTPTHFGEFGRQLAEQYGLTCSVLGREELQQLGMGGVLAVNRGSAEPPTVTVLEYRTGKKVPTLLLVGKGLTFDSGGYSLKPSAGMQDMKFDMCGAAAVMGVMQAVGEWRPAMFDIVAVVPATENLVGPAALKPGDVITQYGGTTVEVINTDAEGRLILADALAYGVERFKPDFVLDVATLTGAVIVGLGHHRTGLLSNDDSLAEKVLAAGAEAGEPLWRLPLGPEYTKQLKSRVADLKNVDQRDAGTILGAAFLQEFVGEAKWAHLDIAGTAWDFTEKSYIPKGPSGVGVRTILELIRTWK